MKALSVKQPWADLIASGDKTIETRSRPTSHRGPLLIVSSKTVDRQALRPGEKPGLLGHAICVADLVDCRPFVPSDQQAAQCSCPPGYYSWVLENVRPIERPFPVRGQLGIFEVQIPENRT